MMRFIVQDGREFVAVAVLGQEVGFVRVIGVPVRGGEARDFRLPDIMWLPLESPAPYADVENTDIESQIVPDRPVIDGPDAPENKPEKELAKTASKPDKKRK